MRLVSLDFPDELEYEIDSANCDTQGSVSQSATSAELEPKCGEKPQRELKTRSR